MSDDSDNEFDDSSESLVSSLNKALDNLYPEDGEETETDEKTEPEESEEERLAREQLESEALARQLMAEEVSKSSFVHYDGQTCDVSIYLMSVISYEIQLFLGHGKLFYECSISQR